MATISGSGSAAVEDEHTDTHTAETEEDEHTRLEHRCQEVAGRILDCFSPHIRTNKEEAVRAVYADQALADIWRTARWRKTEMKLLHCAIRCKDKNCKKNKQLVLFLVNERQVSLRQCVLDRCECKYKFSRPSYTQWVEPRISKLIAEAERDVAAAGGGCGTSRNRAWWK